MFTKNKNALATARIITVVGALLAIVIAFLFVNSKDFNTSPRSAPDAEFVIDSTGSTLSPADKKNFSNRASKVGVTIYVSEAPAWDVSEKPGTVLQANLLERRVEVSSDTVSDDVTYKASADITQSAAATIDESLSVIEDYYDNEAAKDKSKYTLTSLIAVISFSALLFLLSFSLLTIYYKRKGRND